MTDHKEENAGNSEAVDTNQEKIEENKTNDEIKPKNSKRSATETVKIKLRIDMNNGGYMSVSDDSPDRSYIKTRRSVGDKEKRDDAPEKKKKRLLLGRPPKRSIADTEQKESPSKKKKESEEEPPKVRSRSVSETGEDKSNIKDKNRPRSKSRTSIRGENVKARSKSVTPRKGSAVDSKLRGPVPTEDCEKELFCWVCHKPEELIYCKACPRAYHLKCANLNDEPDEDWICIECDTIISAETTHSRSRSSAMKSLSILKLAKLLKFTLNRMKNTPQSEPFWKPVDEIEFPNYKKYISNPMDLNMLENNIKDSNYGSTESFLADAKWLYHNSVIFNSKQSPLTITAKLLVKICKQEMTEIENCPDCYYNAHTIEDWFLETCRTPHLLVWARLKGYPFWPAKIMTFNNKTQQVDVRFFGAHDKAWIPLQECFMLSNSPPILPNKKRVEWESSTRDVLEHISNLKSKHGEFKYFPERTPYQPELHDELLQQMLPNFDNSVVANTNVSKKMKKKVKNVIIVKTPPTEEIYTCPSPAIIGEDVGESAGKCPEDEIADTLVCNSSNKDTTMVVSDDEAPSDYPDTELDPNRIPEHGYSLGDSIRHSKEKTDDSEEVKETLEDINMECSAVLLDLVNKVHSAFCETQTDPDSTDSKNEEEIEKEDKNTTVKPLGRSERLSKRLEKMKVITEKKKKKTENNNVSEETNKTIEKTYEKVTRSNKRLKKDEIKETKQSSGSDSPVENVKSRESFKKKVKKVVQDADDIVILPSSTDEGKKKELLAGLGLGATNEINKAKEIKNEPIDSSLEQKESKIKIIDKSKITTNPKFEKTYNNKKKNLKGINPNLAMLKNTSNGQLILTTNNKNVGNKSNPVSQLSLVQLTSLSSGIHTNFMNLTNETIAGSTIYTPVTSNSSVVITGVPIMKNNKNEVVMTRITHCKTPTSSALTATSSLSKGGTISVKSPASLGVKPSLPPLLVKPGSQVGSSTTLPILNRYVDTISIHVKKALEDIMKDVGNQGCMEAKYKSLQIEMERIQWRHQQEILELKQKLQSAERNLGEIRSSLDAEKQKALRELTAQMERKIEETKGKQWCANCKKEALFYCCWNTSYCDYPCQRHHWVGHMNTCTQIGTNPGGSGGVVSTPSNFPNNTIQYSNNYVPIIPRMRPGAYPGVSGLPNVQVREERTNLMAEVNTSTTTYVVQPTFVVLNN